MREMTKFLIAILAVTLHSAPLVAGNLNNPDYVAPMSSTSNGYTAKTFTNSSAIVLAARAAPKWALSLKNESATASIAICFGASCTAALNTAGSVTLAPGQLWSAGPAFIPLDQINGISSAATSPATFGSN